MSRVYSITLLISLFHLVRPGLSKVTAQVVGGAAESARPVNFSCAEAIQSATGRTAPSAPISTANNTPHTIARMMNIQAHLIFFLERTKSEDLWSE